MTILYEVGYELFNYAECHEVIFRTLDQVAANRVRDIINGEIRTQELDKTIYEIKYKVFEEAQESTEFTDDLRELDGRVESSYKQVYPLPDYRGWGWKPMTMISGNTSVKPPETDG